MNSGLVIFLALLTLGVMAFQVWLIVIAIRFLRSGRKAFDRYTDMHPPLPTLPVPAPPSAPGWASPADPHSKGPHHQSGA